MPAASFSAPSRWAVFESRLGFWPLYFLLKAALFFTGGLRFSLVPNAAFFLCVFLSGEARGRAARVGWGMCNAGLGLFLLWRDSWLPSPVPLETFRLAGDLSLGEIAAAFIGWEGAAALVGVFTAWVFAHGRMLVAPWAAAVLLAAGAADAARRDRGTAHRAFFEFHQREAVRREPIPAAPRSRDFDIVIVQADGLGAADIERAGLEGDSFWKSFDFNFTEFNSAAATGEETALRLARSLCGQSPRERLFEPIPEGCSLFGELGRLGYRVYGSAAYVDARDKTLASLSSFGALGRPVSLAQLSARSTGADGSLEYSLRESLERLWSVRIEEKAPRALLYLHARPAAFPVFFSDISLFRESLKTFDAPVLFIVLGSSGAGAVTSKVQPKGMRYFPVPSVSKVAAAAALPIRAEEAIVVDAQSSHLALAALIRRLLEAPEFPNARASFEALQLALPKTPFVAQSAFASVLLEDGRVHLRDREGVWRELPR